MPNATHTFWKCFERALANNKKTPDGKRRIFSIISNEFTYEELKQNLNVNIFCKKFIIKNYENVLDYSQIFKKNIKKNITNIIKKMLQI